MMRVSINQAYIVISPARNEGRFLVDTIASMRNQTIPPLKWVIVDDGSTDNTSVLVREAMSRVSWIELVTRADRGFRQAGVGVVDAFYAGFERVAALPWQYVVKMDADLRLPPDYFERVMAAFDAYPRLGICSGDIVNETSAGLVLDSPGDPAFHVRGAAKMYRRECWQSIGGIARVTGFDTIDNVRACMLAWETRRIPELQVIHLRKTGLASSRWQNAVKNGTGANAIGYHPCFLLAKCLKRLFAGAPVEAVGQLVGFATAYFKPISRVDDRELIRYLRCQQINRLLGRNSIWR